MGYPCLIHVTPGCIPGAPVVVTNASRCAGLYSLLLYGVGGLYTAEVSCFESLTVERKVNTPAKAIITFDARDEINQYLNLDTMVEVWRSNPLLGIGLYKESELFHRTGKYYWDEKAQAKFVSSLVGYENLLDRRVLLGGDDEAYCIGYPTETSMKRMVMVQCSVQGSRNLISSPVLGLTVDGDLARGATWTGYRKGAKLLSYLQEIAEAKDMAFKVIGVVPGTFVFKAYPNPFGADRTATGMNRTTGRNSAGNIPIIFSEQRGNVSTMGYGMMREVEGNVAVDVNNNLYVKGSGDTDSPWNHCEFTMSTPTDETTDNVAATALASTGAWEDVPVTVIQSPACCYGKHYFLGDRVSVYVAIPGVGKVITKVITGMKLTVSRTQGELDEKIELELSSLARVSRDPIQEALINLTKRLRKVELRV